MGFKLINFVAHGDENGALIAVESGKEIPFAVKRVYYIYNTVRHAVRGRHAHANLEQLIFCPSGSCDFIVDDGRHKTCITMDDPRKGLYVKGNIWREFTNFSPKCVVMVLASEYYDDKDYITDYAEFLKMVLK
ncbi:MAG: sugar 3,4-ketoisomerase [Candidatus Adiutrix sp.]